MVARNKKTHDSAERRSWRRFPIWQDVSYKGPCGPRGSEEGIGKILDVSSSGVSFTTERTLSVGKTMEVAVEWPALLDNKCLMKLVIEGRVVRSDANSAAVAIEHYEFRTRGSKAVPVVLDPPFVFSKAG